MSKQETAEERARARVKEVREFYGHLGVYLLVILFLLILNLMTGPETLWVVWPALGWGIGIALHGWNVLVADRVFDSGWEDRQVEKQLARSTGDHVPQAPEKVVATDISRLTSGASRLIDQMRSSARQIPNTNARRQALDACAASDQVLAAIIDHPDELPLARDFVHRFLEPATQVVTDYSRLSNRNVPSARATLEQVEQHDLPLITKRANELYDRLHRATLIDLEVAREMLTLDMADTSVPKVGSDQES